MQGDDDLTGADGIGSKYGAVQHQVWPDAHQECVLV